MITKLKIDGYKSIKSMDLDLKPINILLGGNGVGKSNFISLFSLLRNIYEQQLQNYVAKKGGADRFLHYGKKMTDKIVVAIEFGAKEQEGTYRCSITLETWLDSLGISSTQTAFKSDENWQTEICDQSVLESGFRDRKEEQFTAINDLLKSFSVYHFHDTGDQSPLKGKCKIADNRVLKSDGSNLPAFLYFLKIKHPKSFLRIEKAVQAVAPFFHSFVLEPDRLNEENIQLEWKDKGNLDHYLNAYDLSDGTLRFIALATLLLQPNPPTTIVIDEPELGLHPVAINKLSALIRKVSKKVQIIVSTQSTNLVDNFNPEDVVVVNRKEDSSHFERLDKKALAEWLEDYSLSELWGKNIFGGQPYRI